MSEVYTMHITDQQRCTDTEYVMTDGSRLDRGEHKEMVLSKAALRAMMRDGAIKIMFCSECIEGERCRQHRVKEAEEHDLAFAIEHAIEELEQYANQVS